LDCRKIWTTAIAEAYLSYDRKMRRSEVAALYAT